MTVKEILSTLENAKCDWDQLCSETYEKKVAEKLPEESYEWIKYGISKMAILFNNCNFVIKIPFAGWGHNDEDDDGFPIFIFDDFCSANDIDGHEWDYCYNEVNTVQKVLDYDNSHDTHIMSLFAETEYVGNVNCMPIYAQPRCIPVVEYDGELEGLRKHHTPESQKAVSEAYSKYGDAPGLTTSWCNDVVLWYGQETLEALLDFLTITEISDFHEGNIGYTMKGAPVIIDYADYYDD